MNASLPEPFRALEPWVGSYAIVDESGRFNKRVSTTRVELDAFVQAVRPRIDEIIGFLNTIPTSSPDSLGAEERRLFDLAMMWMEASIPADLDWDGNDIEDAWPAERLEFIGPSRLAVPSNRPDLAS